MTNKNKTWLYYLIDPTTKEIKYIGVSQNPTRRLQLHIEDRTDKEKRNWIKGLAKKKLKPQLRFVKSGEREAMRLLSQKKVRELRGKGILNELKKEKIHRFNMRIVTNEYLELKRAALRHTNGNISKLVRDISAHVIHTEGLAELYDIIKSGEKIRKRKYKK